MSITQPDYHGIDGTFAISVLGGVSGYFIGRLIEAALTRIVGPPGHIFVTDQEKNVTFHFPEDRDACLDHFGVIDAGQGVRGWVFVSHASQDAKFIENEVLSLLYKNGNRPWYSYYQIKAGEEWERRIFAGLRISEWFLVVLSNSAVTSNWVRAEVHWAMENRKDKIIPLLLQECAIDELHLKLPTIQYIDFRKGRTYVETALQEVLGSGPCHRI